MLFDFESDLVGPSIDANSNPVATPSLYSLLVQVQKQTARGSPESFYLFKAKTKTVKPTKKGAKLTTTTTHSLKGNADTEAALLKRFGGKVPPGYVELKVPAHMIVISAQPRPAASAPRARRRQAPTTTC